MDKDTLEKYVDDWIINTIAYEASIKDSLQVGVNNKKSKINAPEQYITKYNEISRSCARNRIIYLISFILRSSLTILLVYVSIKLRYLAK